MNGAELTSAALPHLMVVYGTGAASPTEILTAAAGLCRVTFAMPSDDPVVNQVERVVGTRAEFIRFDGEAELKRYLTELAPTLLTTFAEDLLEVTAAAAAGSGLAMDSPATVEALRDKVEQRQLLARAGLAVPWFKRIRRDEVASAYLAAPVPALVLKPAAGSGSLHTYRVAEPLPVPGMDLTQLPDVDYILEEELAGAPTGHESVGDYGSVEMISVRGEHTPLAVVGRFPVVAPFRERGGFHPSAWSGAEKAEMSRLAVEALRALGVSDGLSHVEIKRGPDGPRIIEVNGRLGGNVAALLARSAGTDLVREWLSCALSAAVGRTKRPMPVREDAARLCYRWCLYADGEQPGVLREIRGLPQLRGLPHVERLSILKRRGEVIDWRAGTASAVVVVDGSVGDFDELDHVHRELSEIGSVVLEPVSGDR
ncbi:ATP-grasp domain-containing protein [Kribbella sp. NPDC051718]|uniref:ATP-grasp domain-containing protein n=1 Tax=Kribbella sp. NPDC051718 TaxID=3155168 RepID=UPI00343A43D7